MCEGCDDFSRTVRLLGDLTLYVHGDSEADLEFVVVVGEALAASLPSGPADGPAYPAQGL